MSLSTRTHDALAAAEFADPGHDPRSTSLTCSAPIRYPATACPAGQRGLLIYGVGLPAEPPAT